MIIGKKKSGMLRVEPEPLGEKHQRYFCAMQPPKIVWTLRVNTSNTFSLLDNPLIMLQCHQPSDFPKNLKGKYYYSGFWNLFQYFP